MTTEQLRCLILTRLHELQQRVQAQDVAAHLLRERADELRQLLARLTALVDGHPGEDGGRVFRPGDVPTTDGGGTGARKAVPPREGSAWFFDL